MIIRHLDVYGIELLISPRLSCTKRLSVEVSAVQEVRWVTAPNGEARPCY